MEPHDSYKINIHIAKFPIKKVSGISGDFRSAPVLFSSVLHCSTNPQHGRKQYPCRGICAGFDKRNQFAHCRLGLRPAAHINRSKTWFHNLPDRVIVHTNQCNIFGYADAPLPKNLHHGNSKQVMCAEECFRQVCASIQTALNLPFVFCYAMLRHQLKPFIIRPD